MSSMKKLVLLLLSTIFVAGCVSQTSTPIVNNTTTVSTEPTITIISPTGGETWNSGVSHTISWTSQNVAHFQIWYSTVSSLRCDQEGWTLIQSHPYYLTSVDWTPRNINSNTIRIRVEGHNAAHRTIENACSGEFSVTTQ